jgi:hypothetical protein
MAAVLILMTPGKYSGAITAYFCSEFCRRLGLQEVYG